MKKIKIGCRVKLAQFEQYVFTVTEEHYDGSFTIETELSENQMLHYQNVAQEMLKLIEA